MRESRPHWTHMQGQAGVHAVSAQLMMRGHVPCFPSIDYGFDLMLDNGIKLQVKSGKLRFSHPSYPEGFYKFEVRENFRLNSKRGVMNHLERKTQRNWHGLADFFVFWAVDENRFFIVPAKGFKMSSYYIRRKSSSRPEVAISKIDDLVKLGMTKREISEEIGVAWKNVHRRLGNKLKEDSLCSQLMQFEDRWDLFDINQAAEALVESATEVKV